MSLWAFYALGCFIAFIWGTNDYYEFKVRNNLYKGRIFEDTEDAFNMMVFSLGSWIAVAILIFNDDN
jgi:hypothetical protein